MGRATGSVLPRSPYEPTNRPDRLRTVQPIVPVLAQYPFNDPAWLFEPKFDGYRGLLHVSPAGTAFFSKRCLLMKRFSAFAEELRDQLRGRDALLDGEVVAFDEQGRVDFRLLMRGQGRLHYVAFDLLWLNGRDLRGKRLTERKRRLEQVIPMNTPELSRVLSVEEEGVALFKAAQQLDLEGIVAKRKADPYGPEVRWLNIKNRAYTQMEGRAELLHPR